MITVTMSTVRIVVMIPIAMNTALLPDDEEFVIMLEDKLEFPTFGLVVSPAKAVAESC